MNHSSHLKTRLNHTLELLLRKEAQLHALKQRFWTDCIWPWYDVEWKSLEVAIAELKQLVGKLRRELK
jgi:hypothetical protein